MECKEWQKERNEQCRERHELSVERLRMIVAEETVDVAYQSYFQGCAAFLLELEGRKRYLGFPECRRNAGFQ